MPRDRGCSIRPRHREAPGSTTALSTLGGGRKAARGTSNRISGRAYICASTLRYPYSRPPGEAAIRAATSACTRKTARIHPSASKDLFQDRRRDVVRQVPGDHRRSPSRKIGLEHVAFDQFQPPCVQSVAKLLAEIVDQNRIHFDRDYFTRPFQQRSGKRAFAGTDFNHERRVAAFASRSTSRAGNLFQDGRAREKMLPETPPHSVLDDDGTGKHRNPHSAPG